METLSVFGDAEVEPLAVLAAEVNAEQRLDALPLAQAHELTPTRRVVHVREGQRRDAEPLGRQHKLFGRQRAIAQAVVGMAVEMHGLLLRNGSVFSYGQVRSEGGCEWGKDAIICFKISAKLL